MQLCQLTWNTPAVNGRKKSQLENEGISVQILKYIATLSTGEAFM
jgi:hypothetical protein